MLPERDIHDPDAPPGRTGGWPDRRLVAGLVAVAGAGLGLAALVRGVWAASLSPRALALVDPLRDVFLALATGLLLARALLRAAPPLLVAGSRLGAGPSEEERARSWNRWLQHMRWLAVVVAATLTFVVVRHTGLLPQAVWTPLWLSIAGLAAVNLAYGVLLRAGRAMHHLLRIQVFVDLLALAVLVHFSGGLENPLTMLALLHVIIGGILLSRRECFAVATCACGLFTLLALAEWRGWVAHYDLLVIPHGPDLDSSPAQSGLFVASTLGLQAFILFPVAYFVTTVVARMRSHERNLAQLTERARGEHRLLEQALETTGTGLRVVDRQLRPQWVNRIWQAWFRRDAGEASEPVPAAAGGEAAGTVRDQQQRSFQDGYTRMCDYLLEVDGGADREARVVQITTAPLRDAEGQVVQVAELARDVTDQRRTQEMVTRAGKMAAIGELAANVAHEVNNPVGILSAKARLLLSRRADEMSPKVREELEKIVALSDRVARIAEGLLSYSRPSPARREPMDMLVPIRKAIGLVKDRWQTTGVRVEERLEAGLPPVVANANELEQVFLNLLLNALDAMPDGGTLQVSAGPADAPVPGGEPCVMASVEDSGPGIPEADVERVFDPFFTSKGERGGTGLGLSICHGIVHGHGGTIRVGRGARGGARFEVRLPVAGNREGP